MKKLKDMFYDLNDIMVAVVILGLAAFVIFSNINSILNYPNAIAAEVKTPEKQTPTHYADNPPLDQQGNVETTTDQAVTSGSGVDDESASNQGSQGSQDSGSGEVEKYSVYINPGSTGQQIADIMISVGLFKDRQEFYNAVTAAGADGKLKAGNFIIPSDATPAEVIKIITK